MVQSINIDLLLSGDFIYNFCMVITLCSVTSEISDMCLLPMKMLSVEKEVTQIEHLVMILRYELYDSCI
jgi:hypothetical protein